MEQKSKKIFLILLTMIIAIAMIQSYAFAEPVPEGGIDPGLSEELPPGGWTPPESYYIEEELSVPELPILRALPENEDDVFSKGACTVGYDALKKEGQKSLYEELDIAAREFAFSDTDLSPTRMNDAARTQVYIFCSIVYASKGLTPDEARQAFVAYDYDHPAYYWLDNDIWYTDSVIYMTTFKEYASASERARINGLVSEGVKEYAKKAECTEDTLDKIAIIHDLIDSEVKYAYKSDGTTPVDSKWAHSVHGLFDPSHREVVCEGYADTFSLMMNYFDIPCYYIVGNAVPGGLHAWNAVSDDGGKTYMYMDLTWDDIKDGTYYYKYFGMPKSDFETSHIPRSGDGVGTEWLYELKGDFCDSFEDTYYYRGGFYCDSEDCSEIINKANTKAHRIESILTLLCDMSTLQSVASEIGLSSVSYYDVKNNGKKYYAIVNKMTDKVDLSDAQIVLDAVGYAYSGSEVKPQPKKVRCNGVNLIAGLNYDVSYQDNIEIGNAAKVIVTGKGGFSGSCNASFIITDKAVSDESIKMSASEFEYNGTSQKPDITVTVKGKVLEEGRDYVVSFPEDTTNVGTVVIIVTGKGEYSGTVKKQYNIVPASISSYEITLSDENMVYDGSPKTPAVVSVGKTGSAPIDSECYDIHYDDNINAGNGKVTVYGKGNYKDSCEKLFAIKPAGIEDAVVDCERESYEYDGTAVKPDVSDFIVTLRHIELQPGTDYEISGYADNDTVGEASVFIKGKGNYTGTVSGRFLIIGKAFTVFFEPQGGICNETEKEVIYGGRYEALPDPEYTGYEFLGWFTEAEGGENIDADSIYTKMGNQTVYAHWRRIKITITLNPNGGTCGKGSIIVEYGGKYEGLPDAKKEGAIFEGWAEGADDGARIIREDDIVDTINDITLYARWADIIYSERITLDKDSLLIKYGETASLSANVIPDNATYKSVFWTSSDEEIAAVDAFGNVTGKGEGKAEITVKSEDGRSFAVCQVTVKMVEDIAFVDTAGKKITLIHNIESNTYKTADGEDVLDISGKDGSSGVSEFQFTAKKITPGKNTFILYNGVVYRYKTDYTISYKKNKARGTAIVKTRWKKGSDPYKKGERSVESEFMIVPRTVSQQMVNVLMRGIRLKKITVYAEGKKMKPKKTDYTYALSGNGIKIDFTNNYSGSIYCEKNLWGGSILATD